MTCHHIALPDGGSAIVCTGGRGTPRPCACGAPATHLCDGAGRRPGRPCSAPICDACRTAVDPEHDLCPACASALARALRWDRGTDYSIHARGTEYRVSRSHGAVDADTGEIDTRYSAWWGPLLRDQPRKESAMPALLGICRSADGARALCVADMLAHPERGTALLSQ